MLGEASVRTGRELQMLETMVDCAHALGMAFGFANARGRMAELRVLPACP
jgi:hypothetical protein